MLNKELAAKFAEEIRNRRNEQPKEFEALAKKSAAKKLMDAFKNSDEDAFLTALSELEEMKEHG